MLCFTLRSALLQDETMKVAIVLLLALFSGCAQISPKVNNNKTAQTIEIIEPPTVRDHAQFFHNPYEQSAAFVKQGRAVYFKHCAACHGSEGEEPFYHAIKYHALRHTEGDYFWIVTYGVEGTNMSGFKGTLTIEERWQVVAFLRKELAWKP